MRGEPNRPAPLVWRRRKLTPILDWWIREAGPQNLACLGRGRFDSGSPPRGDFISQQTHAIFARLERAPASELTPAPLPAIVQSYLERAAGRQPAPRALWLRPIGERRIAPEARWQPFTAEQVISIHRPGSAWLARMQVMPLSVHILDCYVDGEGSLASRAVPISARRDSASTRPCWSPAPLTAPAALNRTVALRDKPADRRVEFRHPAGNCRRADPGDELLRLLVFPCAGRGSVYRLRDAWAHDRRDRQHAHRQAPDPAGMRDRQLPWSMCSSACRGCEV